MRDLTFEKLEEATDKESIPQIDVHLDENFRVIGAEDD